MAPTESIEPVTPAITEKIASFRGDLARFNVAQIVQRHITFGTCHVLDDDQYFEIKLRIADNFRIHPSSVIVVGSSKLGFSIASGKRYRPFGDTSDIDAAIVSAPLFDDYWKAVFDYKTQRNFWEKEAQFNSYLARGWIRPDMLPPARRFAAAKEWWDFFRELTKTMDSDYKISGALYRDWYFLERYQGICVKECQDDEGKS